MNKKQVWVFIAYLFVMFILIPFVIGRIVENNKCSILLQQQEIAEQMKELERTFDTMDR